MRFWAWIVPRSVGRCVGEVCSYGKSLGVDGS